MIFVRYPLLDAVNFNISTQVLTIKNSTTRLPKHTSIMVKCAKIKQLSDAKVDVSRV